MAHPSVISVCKTTQRERTGIEFGPATRVRMFGISLNVREDSAV